MNDEKSVRQLERELKSARIREKEQHDANITKNRDYSIGGIDPNATTKLKPGASDIPDVILLPKKKTQRKENIPY